MSEELIELQKQIAETLVEIRQSLESTNRIITEFVSWTQGEYHGSDSE